MKHKVTPRQLEALVAVYFGESPWDEPSGIYSPEHSDPAKAGKPYWHRRTNMGGAISRMVQTLYDNEFLSRPNAYERREKKPYADGYNLLTVKAYHAIAERLDSLPVIKNHRSETIYQFSIDAAELEQRKSERAAREAEMDRLRKEEQDAERARRVAAGERAREQRLTKLREMFKERGLADNWSDVDLLEFADRVASI